MRSIKTKTTIFVGGILFLMIAVLVAVNLLFAEPYFISQKEKAIESLFGSLKKEFSDDTAALQGIVATYEDASSLQVEIFDAEMDLIYTTGRKMDEGFAPFPSGKPPDGKRLSQEDFSRTPAVEIAGKEKSGSGFLVLHGIVSFQEQPRYISIQTPLTAIADSVRVMNQLTLVVSAVLLVLGCVAAYFFAVRYARPIQNIEKVAQCVAELDFSRKAAESSSAELESLSESINKMSDKLSGFIAELVEKNQLLSRDNERLAKLEEMRREFVANVSHELKSPLALLTGYAEMLKNHVEGLDTAECCEIIVEQSEKMNGMIKSMLDVASIEHGLKQVQKQKTDFSSYIRNLIEKEAFLINNGPSFLESDIEEGCQVLGDCFYLDQAVRNYLHNAVSHTVPGGKVFVRLYRDAQDVVFSVYNDGDTIPEAKQQKIWDSFYKTDEARTRSEGNNIGLGLYIVKTVISSHDGVYGVKNHAGGVEFYFRLKAVD